MKLQEVCEVYSGYALKEFHDSDEGYPVIKIGNICSDGTLDLEKCQFTNDSVNEKYYSKKGDIYVALSGATTGKIGVINTDDKYIVNQRVGIVRKTDNEIPDHYIKYFLMNKTEKILEDASGCAQPNISPKQIGQYEFPKLDYYEMNNISVILDGVSNVITQRKQEIQKLDDLIKARFVELFGNTKDNEKNWDTVSLKSVAEVRGRVGWKGYKKDDLRESGPLVLGATHLTDSGCIDLTSPVYLSREKYEESPEIMLQKNDLIFTQRGNTIGKVGLLENDIGEATINPCVLILRPLTINPVYFKTYFILDETKRDMWSLNAGSAQPMITQKGIGEYMLMLPPMELQNQFASFVKQTDKSKFAVQKALDEAQLLFDSLMQKYFG